MITAPIVDGQVVAEQSKTHQVKDTTGTGELGKDAFLQLLITQMENQDPLNPSSDTEYISQLAQFSSLEEMQNLNNTLTNQNAFSLVGKHVIMAVGMSQGKTVETVAGTVQYVEIKEGKAYLSINDNSYSIDDLDTVVDEKYLNEVLNSGNKPEENPEDNTENDADDQEEKKEYNKA